MDLKKNAMNFITYSLSHINLRNLPQRVFAKNCRFVLEDWVFLPAPRALACSHGWQAAGAPQGLCARVTRARSEERGRACVRACGHASVRAGVRAGGHGREATRAATCRTQ